jgi:hypothetical protein
MHSAGVRTATVPPARPHSIVIPSTLCRTSPRALLPADLQYKNVRPDYLNAIWNVFNWADAAKRLEQAKKA